MKNCHRIAPETAVRRGSAVWPRRPGSEYLSEAIRLFFIARDSNGFWIAREANGALGGRFLLRHSAYRFAQTTSRPNGSATMLLKSRHDLDVPDQGSQFASLVASVAQLLRRRGMERAFRAGQSATGKAVISNPRLGTVERIKCPSFTESGSSQCDKITWKSRPRGPDFGGY